MANGVLLVISRAELQELRRFVGMLNFYRRFIPNAAMNQIKLHAYLTNSKERDTSLVPCIENAITAFEKCKYDLVNATLLMHPSAKASLSLTVDASGRTVGAVVKQYENNS